MDLAQMASALSTLAARSSWLLLVAGGAALLWVAVNRPITSVVVEGALSTQERAAVQAALTPNLQTGLLSLQLTAVVDQVQALSWPQAVTVRRVWPNQLVVGVIKQQVVAAWNDSKYLTSTGEVVSLAVAPSGLPKLRSVATQPQVALEIYQRLAALAAGHGTELVALSESATSEWRVTLAPALAIMLGASDTPSELEQRLQRFFVIRAQRPDNEHRQLRYADARYTNGVALKWDDLATDTQSLVATGT